MSWKSGEKVRWYSEASYGGVFIYTCHLWPTCAWGNLCLKISQSSLRVGQIEFHGCNLLFKVSIPILVSSIYSQGAFGKHLRLELDCHQWFYLLGHRLQEISHHLRGLHRVCPCVWRWWWRMWWLGISYDLCTFPYYNRCSSNRSILELRRIKEFGEHSLTYGLSPSMTCLTFFPARCWRMIVT